jgi:hypothetical protein
MPEPTMFEQFTSKYTPTSTAKLKYGEDGYWGQQFSDSDWMSGAAKLGGLAMQSLSLPMQLESANLRNDAMKLDIAGVKEDRADHTRQRAGFNAVAASRPSSDVSAFANPNKSALV